MRIISEWSKEDMRITVFHMNGRYSIKIEKDLYEQVYKFRDGHFENLNEIKEFTNNTFYTKCHSIFKSMHENKLSSGMQKDLDSGFDEII